MTIPADHARQKTELVDKLRDQSKECAAAAKEVAGFPAKLLQDASDATGELAEYISSPIVDDAISAFRDSAASRKDASVDLNVYLREAGLEISDRAEFELHDDNWCVQAVVTVLSEGQEYSVGGHYDSDSGWGAGVCP
jgi:hypothetical protein